MTQEARVYDFSERITRGSRATSNNNNNNNIIINNTEPGVFSESDKILIKNACMEYIGVFNISIMRVIEDAFHVMDLDVIMAAIERTGLAPRPSGAYLRAVLANMKLNEICCKDDLLREKRKRIDPMIW